MTPTGLASISVVLAYLIGAIPFAYVIVRAVKGIDIRTVGSGNVGATNASRVLGLRGFLLVFLLDMAKGLLPTIGLPALVKGLGGQSVADLPVLVALATILGHNFPIYLQFKGGKGVATSLGAMFGLDWMASLAAAVAFLVSLRINRYVSLSSLIGAFVFLVAHFAGVMFVEKRSPWDREHVALSVLTLGLLVMLNWRHRKNWARIREGTEPRISRRKRAPEGKAAIAIVLAVATVGIGSAVAFTISRPATLDCGAFTLVELGRVKTGHQRAIHPAFGDGGRALAVLCPRYNRLMIYRVENEALELASDVTLEGQPMSVCASREGFLVLERPAGDERHVGPGGLQAYGFDGSKRGPRIGVGFYPTELELLHDGRTALVLTLGRAEGNAKLDAPAMEVVDLASGRVVSRVPFEREGDLPCRIAVAAKGSQVAVALKGTNEVAAIELDEPTKPRLLGRSALLAREAPYASVSGEDWILMPVDTEREYALVSPTGASRVSDPMLDYLVGVQVDESALDVRQIANSEKLGTFPLRGPGNVGSIRPTGVAATRERGLLAVTSRSGGVHLVGVRAKAPR